MHYFENSKYNPEKDMCRDYRREEINATVWTVLEKSREHRGEMQITEKYIDRIIEYQDTVSNDKAIRYMKYIFLGECGWMEVYGTDALRDDKSELHYQQSERIEDKLDSMQMQMEQMQMIILNMAKMIAAQQSREQPNYRRTAI